MIAKTELIPDGYKRTEVGVLPEDWDVPQLGQILRSTQLGGNYKNSERETSWPLIKMGNLGRGNINLEKLEYVERTQPPEPRDKLRCGDVLFNTRNTLDLVGKVALWREELPEAYFNSNIMRMEFDDAFVSSSSCMNYILNTPQSLRSLRGIAIGTTSVAAIYGRDLVKVPIPLPTKPEQEAIADALGDADALIESLEQLVAKKRHLKQAAMQQLLTGKKRLPGFEGEWTRKQIGDEIDLLTGFPFPSQSYTEHGIRLLRGSNIKRGVTDWSDEITQCWPRVTTDIKQYQLQAGDIVVAMDGSLVGRSFAQLSDADVPALLLQRVARIRSTSINMAYLKEQVCCDYFTEHCDAVKTVTAIPHISPKDIRAFTIPIPPTKDEQRAIAEILRDMGIEIEAIEAKLAKACQIKQGMMQVLLTGQVRLVTVES